MVFKFGFARRVVLFGALAVVGVVGFVGSASAGGGVTSLTSCGSISSPGKYRLDADVTSGRSSSCFDVTAANVTLYLNGHTITYGCLGCEQGGVGLRGLGDSLVGPGTITGFTEDAVGLVGGADRVSGVTATSSGGGIVIVSSGNSVRGNVVTDTGAGILATSLSTGNPNATGNTIVGNFAHDNQTDLVDQHSDCDSNVWKGNDFGTSDPAQPSCIH